MEGMNNMSKLEEQKVRFAIVGCGRISAAHLDGIKNAPNAELAAVCDVVEEKAKEAAKGNGLEKWYTSLEEMLEVEKFDILCVCTPSGMHCEHTLLAAKYKKHVLCEKPLDVTREKIDMMIKACKEAGVLLGGIYQRRTNAAAIHTRNAIQSGKLGQLVIANASLKYYRDQEYYNSADWRATWELDGGGALMNQGIHGIDLLQWMAGDIESVFARCATLVRNIKVEDTAIISLKFKNGSLGVIEGATSVYPGQDTIFSIHGEYGSIVIGDKGFYTWKFLNSNDPVPEAGDGFGGINCGWSDTFSGHTKQIQDMAEAVLYGRQPMVPGEEARKAVDLILAIYESSRKGIEVKVN